MPRDQHFLRSRRGTLGRLGVDWGYKWKRNFVEKQSTVGGDHDGQLNPRITMLPLSDRCAILHVTFEGLQCSRLGSVR